MLGWYAPVSVPKTYASGPSVDLRFRIGASRPSGLKGMRRFSLSLAQRLRQTPVHRRPQRFERPVDRCDLDLVGIVRLGLETIDLIGLFECVER
jgi:hypothetical protein